MPRKPREFSETGLYHVCIKGVGSMAIFRDDADRRIFIKRMATTSREMGVRLLAWCLMTNHVHIVVRDDAGALSEMMHKLTSGYAQLFNKTVGRQGHLFKSRFWSSPLVDEAHLIATIRYVHANPARAGIAEASAYPWSSYREYAVKEKLADTSLVLGMLGGRKQFLALMSIEQKLDPVPRHSGELSDFEVARLMREAGLDRHGAGKRLHGEEREVRDAKIRAVCEGGATAEQVGRLAGLSVSSVRRALRGD